MSISRQEFESILKNIFYGLAFRQTSGSSVRSVQEAVITNSKRQMDVFAESYLRALERISHYLSQWDNAPNQRSKDAVVGSVLGDLGNAPVNPEDAYLWPPTQGHFGDLKGPIYDSNYTRTYSARVDGTVSGNTSIFISPTGKRFVPQLVNFTLLQVSGLSLVGTCSVGTNPLSFNNILGATLLTGLSDVNSRFGISLTGVITTVSAAEEVFCRVSIPSTAST